MLSKFLTQGGIYGVCTVKSSKLVWRSTPGIPVLGSFKQEDFEFKASLRYVTRLSRKKMSGAFVYITVLLVGLISGNANETAKAYKNNVLSIGIEVPRPHGRGRPLPGMQVFLHF